MELASEEHRWVSLSAATSTARQRTGSCASTATPPRHEIRDLNVSTSLRGEFTAAHTDGDQAKVLPTDTQKNTAFAYAKEHGVSSPEDYAIALGRRFLEATPAATGADPRRGVRLGPHPGRTRGS